MSNKKERLKALKEKRDALIKKYKEYAIFISGMQDQIADIEGDIRMLEDEQKKENS
jgi:predicted  nucleic acid-binding Zn-ribbon protein